MSKIVLLGPQRLHPILASEVGRAGVIGPIAAVTSGWQEREPEVDELQHHLGGRLVNLELYRRAEIVFEEDEELFQAYRARQDRLHRIQELYRVRLSFAMEPARRLLRRPGDPSIIEPARESAIDAVRRLDGEHLSRLQAVHEEFDDRWRPLERESVRRQRAEIEALLADCEGFAIAGGHVAVLLYRLRFFDLPSLVGDRTVFAWSAGAMAASEHIVLFHDRPPQGRGDAELLDRGLGLFQDVVVLPHARHRLATTDPVRMSLLARRFPEATCVAMDERAVYRFDGRVWSGGGTTRIVESDGSLAEVDAA